MTAPVEMSKELPEQYPILIVDDHPTNRQVMALLINGMGLRSEAAASGLEAVTLAKRKSYAAILMDLMMPGMDGYEATKQIRADEFGKGTHTPIIAVTAVDLSQARDKCLAAGMDDFILKPITRDILRDRLERWLQQPVAALLAEFRSSVELAHAEGGPINRERLKLLYGTDKIDDLLSLFLSASEALLCELKGAIAERNQDEASRVAHELKGSAVAISAEEMSLLARNLEKTAQQGEWQSALQIYGDLAVSFVKIQQQLAARAKS